jgi:protein-S-isoprenylcysteine O-methyltransferase Ste14
MEFGQVAPLALVSRILVAVGWAGFFIFFFSRGRLAGQNETKRAPASVFGIALQMVGFAMVWMLQRKPPAAGVPLSAPEIALDVLAPVLSIVSAWIGLAAVRTLGRQWSYTARLVENHKLVTEGPYNAVRHPIYTAMFGKLLATNFAFGHWIGLPVAGGIFVAGTLIRIRSEERLLREAFGTEYESYARRVPSFIPFVA